MDKDSKVTTKILLSAHYETARTATVRGVNRSTSNGDGIPTIGNVIWLALAGIVPRLYIVGSIASIVFLPLALISTYLDIGEWIAYTIAASLGIVALILGQIPGSRFQNGLDATRNWLIDRKQRRWISSTRAIVITAGFALFCFSLVLGRGLLTVWIGLAVILIFVALLPIWTLSESLEKDSRADFGFWAMFPHWLASLVANAVWFVCAFILIPMAITGFISLVALVAPFVLVVPLTVSLLFSRRLLRVPGMSKERYLEGTVALRVTMLCFVLMAGFLVAVSSLELEETVGRTLGGGLVAALLVVQPFIATFGKGVSEFFSAKGSLPSTTLTTDPLTARPMQAQNVA